jgi:hypothetical protein
MAQQAETYCLLGFPRYFPSSVVFSLTAGMKPLTFRLSVLARSIDDSLIRYCARRMAASALFRWPLALSGITSSFGMMCPLTLLIPETDSGLPSNGKSQ